MFRIALYIVFICIIAQPAHAVPPVVAAIGSAIGAVSAGITAAFGGALGSAIASIGLSFVVSAAMSLITGKKNPGAAPVKQQDIIRELLQPNALPVKRFVYGRTIAPGTPAPLRVKDDILYCCFILNSRPSAGPFTVYLDKREVAFTGDPYDFAGDGAVATNSPFNGHCQYWIGRGDQIGPPLNLLRQLGGAVVEWNVDSSFVATVFEVMLTINETSYTWSRSQIGLALRGPFTGGGGGFSIAVSSNTPFAVEVTNSNPDLAFQVQSGSCKRAIFGSEGTTTHSATSISNPADSELKGTDGWQGLTVIWLRLNVGSNSNRTERWPATPPEVLVLGSWSLVLDPREPEEPPAYSSNQALCVLDALRNNPIRKYDDRNLWLDSFKWAADVADEPFEIKGGGTIPKFRSNGILVFSEGSELEDQILPLYNAGASNPLRVGGRLGILPATYSEPVATLQKVLGDTPAVYNVYRPSSELVTEVSATYVSPARFYEDAVTPTYIIEGAQELDGGLPKPQNIPLTFVTDHRQAQYVAAILGRRTRMQKQFSATFPAEAFNLLAGAGVMLDFPAPYSSRNGEYMVEQNAPAGDPVGQTGFAMRCQMILRENSASIYEWDAETDEQEVVIEQFDSGTAPIAPPGAVTATSDISTAIISGTTVTPRIFFKFPQSVSQSVIAYEWGYRENQSGASWQSGGSIDVEVVNNEGESFGYISPIAVGQSYLIRVRSISPRGTSGWVQSNSVTASAGGFLAGEPTAIEAVGGNGEIEFSFRAPNSGSYSYMEIYANSVNELASASLLIEEIFGAANSLVTEKETGLGDEITRYYWARSVDVNGAPSPFSAALTATTLPEE